MLLGLRHHAIVGGDREEHEIDAVRPGQHVADEALVPGNIHDAGPRAVGKIQVREPQIDGDAPLLFFLEPVGVLPGQRLDETRLAVVDVSGGADDVGHVTASADASRLGGPLRNQIVRIENRFASRGGTGRP